MNMDANFAALLLNPLGMAAVFVLLLLLGIGAGVIAARQANAQDAPGTVNPTPDRTSDEEGAL